MWVRKLVFCFLLFFFYVYSKIKNANLCTESQYYFFFWFFFHYLHISVLHPFLKIICRLMKLLDLLILFLKRKVRLHLFLKLHVQCQHGLISKTHFSSRKLLLQQSSHRDLIQYLQVIFVGFLINYMMFQINISDFI